MAPELQALLRARMERLGYLGEFFQLAAHQPQALASFVAYSEQLKQNLPERLVEVIALTVASETRNAYERVQHEHLALRMGFAPQEIAAVTRGTVEQSGAFSEAEITAAKLAACMVHSHGHACGSESDRLVALLGEATAVGCVMMAARYLAHSAMANTWRLAQPVRAPPTPQHADG
jgi:alkylhydroperoxidase family enzyme